MDLKIFFLFYLFNYLYLTFIIKKDDFYNYKTDILEKFEHLIEIENFGNKL